MYDVNDIVYYNGIPFSNCLNYNLCKNELPLGYGVTILYKGIDTQLRCYSYVCWINNKSIWVDADDVHKYFCTLDEIRSRLIDLIV